MFRRAVERRLKYLTPSRVKKFPPIEKPETPACLRKLLTLSESFEEESFENESVISDVFEEYHKESYLAKNDENKKRPSKTEVDWLMVEGFSDLYKSTVKKIRDEFELKSAILGKDIDETRKNTETCKEKTPLPEEVLRRIKKIQADEEYFHEPLETIEIPVPTIEPKSSASSYDALSGVWHQLTVECKGTKFFASHPNFNAYRQDEPHWLEQDHLSYHTMEDSIQKCIKWLDKCED